MLGVLGFLRRGHPSAVLALSAPIVLLASLMLFGCQQTPSAENTKIAPQSTAASEARSTPVASKPKQWSSPPAMAIDADKKGYTAILETSEGKITIELFAKDAPNTVNNFVFLAREGFYDGTVFHRIVKDFMIQGGDPTGRGTGGPGYRFNDELPVKRSYEPGMLAMANAGRNTQSSQFFIVNGPSGKGLDRQPNYTQFGKVTDGMDTVQRISNLPVVANPEMNGEVSKPKEPPLIKSIKIEEYDLR